MDAEKLDVISRVATDKNIGWSFPIRFELLQKICKCLTFSSTFWQYVQSISTAVEYFYIQLTQYFNELRKRSDPTTFPALYIIIYGKHRADCFLFLFPLLSLTGRRRSLLTHDSLLTNLWRLSRGEQAECL